MRVYKMWGLKKSPQNKKSLDKQSNICYNKDVKKNKQTKRNGGIDYDKQNDKKRVVRRD